MADNIFTRIGKSLSRDDGHFEISDSSIGSSIGKAQAIPSGTIGTSASSAFETGGLLASAEERRLNLLGAQRYDVYDRLVRDVGIIAAGVRLHMNLLSNAVWTVNPPENLTGNELAVAQGYADEAYDMIFDMTSSWATVVKKIAAYKFQGFAIMEWTAKMRPDGVIGIKDIEHRPQRTIVRWLRDKGGTIEGVVQQVAGGREVTIPRSKIVYAVDDTLTDAPEGLGLFRHLAKTVDRLDLFMKLEEVGFTTDLRGIPIARAPLGELQAKVEAVKANGDPVETAKAERQRSAMLRPLRDFLEKHIRNAKTGMLLPSDVYVGKSENSTTPSSAPKWAVDLLNGDASSFDAIAAAINRMTQDLARVLGCEHLLLGADGSGSLALAKSKIGTFYMTTTSALEDIVEVVDRDVLEPIADLNGWEEHLRPQMGVNAITERDLTEIFNALAQLATAGAPLLPSDPAVQELYDLLGLTRPPVDAARDDLSLNPNRNDPVDPDAPIEGNPENDIAKRLILKSRRAKRRRRLAA